MRLSLAIVMFLFIVGLHAHSFPEVADRINMINANRDLVSAGEFPYMSILLLNGDLCEGTLVGPSHILTAAQCLFGRNKTDAINFKVLLNTLTTDGGNGVVRVGVMNFIVHENFNPNTKDNDVALLVLQSPVTGVPTVTLPDIPQPTTTQPTAKPTTTTTKTTTKSTTKFMTTEKPTTAKATTNPTTKTTTTNKPTTQTTKTTTTTKNPTTNPTTNKPTTQTPKMSSMTQNTTTKTTTTTKNPTTNPTTSNKPTTQTTKTTTTTPNPTTQTTRMTTKTTTTTKNPTTNPTTTNKQTTQTTKMTTTTQNATTKPTTITTKLTTEFTTKSTTTNIKKKSVQITSKSMFNRAFSTYANSSAVLTGWGTTISPGGSISNTLLKANVVVRDNAICTSQYPAFVGNHMLCASFTGSVNPSTKTPVSTSKTPLSSTPSMPPTKPTTAKPLCSPALSDWESELVPLDYFFSGTGREQMRITTCKQGIDIGGPLFVDGVQVGINSVGYNIDCADPSYTGVYTRVTTYLDWIATKMANNM
ncbi:cell wall protein DAN4-like [Daphnia pulex]|uniref:cell wall protein DAN4-like n=1 Tax=Daphnia pulex TaxID=6669 RepID=UPI001EDD87DF|nr:cell wall protein DAN4-like [Daphnia pulex]XP_046456616.1 cell wall protein DAN4-like [Daphnia pulex]XP_046456617.1 cell wall protein DAN4-like [Daphnia pulex]